MGKILAYFPKKAISQIVHNIYNYCLHCAFREFPLLIQFTDVYRLQIIVDIVGQLYFEITYHYIYFLHFVLVEK